MSEDKRAKELDNKSRTLEKFKDELVKQKNDLDKKKSDFELNKVKELEELKRALLKYEKDFKENLEKDKTTELKKHNDTLLKERVKQENSNQVLSNYEKDFKEKLEEQKTKELVKHNKTLLTEFKDKSDHYKNLLTDITKRDSELTENKVELQRDKDSLSQEKKVFDSEKSKLLVAYNQWIKEEQKIFINTQEEQKVHKLEVFNEKIRQLYSEKENEIANKEKTNKELQANLKVQKIELDIKEKYLESLRLDVYQEEKEKVSEEVKSLNDDLIYFKNQKSKLKEELKETKEELDTFEKYEDRDLPRELTEKKQEIKRLKGLLKSTDQNLNKLELQFDKQLTDYKLEKKDLVSNNKAMLTDILSVNALRSDKVQLEEQLVSKTNLVDFLKGENNELYDRLDSIYSDGTELEERIKDIQQKPYKEIELKKIDKTKPVHEIEFLDDIVMDMKEYGITYPKRLLYAFHTALKCADYSPLTVLSGVSGTGKSELPKLYSYFGGFNFLAEAVQPTWDSPSSMLGFYNTIDRKFDSTNILKFLVQTSQSSEKNKFGLKESMNLILLDEMNLAHIELYFAEFLSKFEQRRGSKGVNLDIQLGTGMNYGLPLDNNVLWIGTMNEDETTKSLSDKVLDRAFSINFPRPTSLKSRKEVKQLNEVKPFEYLPRDTWDKWIKKESIFVEEKEEVIKEYQDLSNSLNEFLAPTGRAIGHRVWQSMEYYLSNHPLVIQNIDNDIEFKRHVKRSFEEQLVQKVMPKLRGIEVNGKEKEALLKIKQLLIDKKLNLVEDFELAMDNPYGQFIWNSANYLEEK